jgi:hypothetical protein
MRPLAFLLESIALQISVYRLAFVSLIPPVRHPYTTLQIHLCFYPQSIRGDGFLDIGLLALLPKDGHAKTLGFDRSK